MDTTDNSAAQEAELRALAVRADSGEALDLSQTAGTQGADAATDTTTEGTTNTQQQTGAALDSGKKPATDATQQKQQPKDTTKDGQQQPPAKPESEYQKFLREKEALQKEKQRLANTWQQVQAEKERIRQGQQQQRQQPAKPAAQAQPDGPLAKIATGELHDIAAQFEAEGDTVLAKKVRAEITRRTTAEQQPPPAQQQTQAAPQIDQEQFLTEWNGHLRQLEQAEPELTKPDSPLRAEVQEVLTGHIYFSERPERIREAVQFAHLRLEAKAAPELRQRVSTLETELTKLRKATAPGGGSTESRGAAQKAFEDMSESERITHLKQRAAAEDAA